ncbi:hypothetical protein DI09_48p230 [Mitosporidium daphniae]|uniref:N-acetyltransferase domain-containing protein n=1 Tax=Mitosporidium daphniae TaxID=1485682 RepID=A0A098VPN1_9MICR|nr:uncharacterized protein DI09_48p230 [Mitosporidium daphniae]KGG51017.1 hypothetical protein DI09_48p230 [Mitosporidium daphniae]|eukprot:XP_013237444.1 uncharacterized protein DI09_48p230 [Mitosporidium daphniae]
MVFGWIITFSSKGCPVRARIHGHSQVSIIGHRCGFDLVFRISFAFDRPSRLAKGRRWGNHSECPETDITLHVFVNNPALILYNRFGFKGESFLVNFYDKYLPPDSPFSKHALFLRLRQ